MGCEGVPQSGLPELGILIVLRPPQECDLFVAVNFDEMINQLAGALAIFDVDGRDGKLIGGIFVQKDKRETGKMQSADILLGETTRQNDQSICVMGTQGELIPGIVLIIVVGCDEEVIIRSGCTGFNSAQHLRSEVIPNLPQHDSQCIGFTSGKISCRGLGKISKAFNGITDALGCGRVDPAAPVEDPADSCCGDPRLFRHVGDGDAFSLWFT